MVAFTDSVAIWDVWVLDAGAGEAFGAVVGLERGDFTDGAGMVAENYLITFIVVLV